MTRQAQEGSTGGTTMEGEREGEREGEGKQARLLRRRLGRSDLRAVSEVRCAVRELLQNWGKPGSSDVAELLTSEIVTNALIHTDDEAEVTATLGEHRLRVEVRDSVRRRPRARVPSPADGTSGRGLMLVQSLADSWGVRALGAGKVVWFELDGEPA